MLIVELISEIKLRNFLRVRHVDEHFNDFDVKYVSLCEKSVNSDERCHFSYQKWCYEGILKPYSKYICLRRNRRAC